MKKLLAVLLTALLTACGPSSDEIKLAEKECVKFINEQMSGAYTSRTKVFDVYSKKGKVVAEVGYQDRHTRGDSYSVRLCVLDIEKGTISSPSPLNDSEWKK